MSVLALNACAPAVRDRAATLDDARWSREGRQLGAGTLAPANVVLHEGVIRLVADGARRTGAALRTRDAYTYGDFRAAMRCAAPRGAVCALFLYQTGVGDHADEIDVELLAGTRELWLTTWVRGQRSNHVRLELPFDPAAGFHVYGIALSEGAVAFHVDDVELHRFTERVPSAAMSLFLNTWWPNWLEPSAEAGDLEIEWIERPAAAHAATAHGS